MLGSTFLGLLLAGSLHVDLVTPEKRPFHQGTAVLQIEARRAAAAPSEEDSILVPVVQGKADTILPPGKWSIGVATPGYWSRRETIAVGDAPREVSLTVWPAGLLRGRFSGDSSTPPPKTVTVAFKPSKERTSVPSGTSDCAVKQGEWQCPVPASTLDVQVRVGDCIPGYFWDIVVPAGRVADLGPFRLRRGASIVGWVRYSDGAAASGIPVTVSSPLRPDQRAPDSEPDVVSKASTTTRGFFQVVDAQAGERRIVAEAGGWLDAGFTTRIPPDTETLITSPLILKQAAKLTIRVTPPVDPRSEAWRLTLYRSDPVQVLFRDREIPETGEVADLVVPQGRYRIEVTSRENGSVWYRETVDVDSSGRVLDIRLPVMLVEGTVTLGGKPIAAQLVFGGSYSNVKIELNSDEDGRFRGAVRGDHAPEWEVDIAGDTPFVRRTLRGVRITPPPDGGAARVDLALPETVLHGVVRWEEGEPKPRGMVVTAYGLTDETSDGVQTRTDDGAFRFEGLPPGEYRVSAEARGSMGLLSSDERSVVIGEETSPSVDLLLRSGRKLVGRLVTSDGEPIPDGSVLVVSADNPLAGGQTSRSDADGIFTQTLQPGTKAVHLSVSALGYAFRMLRAPLNDGADPVTIVVNREGGTLAIDFPPGHSGRPWEGVPYLFHDGSLQAVSLFGQWATSHAGDWSLQEGHVVIPSMAEGIYVVCTPSSSSVLEAAAFGRLDGLPCVRGTLKANATLRLRVPSSQSESTAR